MIQKLNYTIYKSILDKNYAYADGYFKEDSNSCQFRSGNNIISVKEHFGDKLAAESLIENVICYEKNNSDNS